MGPMRPVFHQRRPSQNRATVPPKGNGAKGITEEGGERVAWNPKLVRRESHEIYNTCPQRQCGKLTNTKRKERKKPGGKAVVDNAPMGQKKTDAGKKMTKGGKKKEPPGNSKTSDKRICTHSVTQEIRTPINKQRKEK